MNPRFGQHPASGLWGGVRRFVVHERPALYVMVAIPVAAVSIVLAMNGNCAPLTASLQSVSALAGEVGRTLLQELRDAMSVGL